VALGAQDEQPTSSLHHRRIRFALRPRLGQRSLPLLRRHLGEFDALLAELLPRQAIRVAAQQNIDTTTGHVGGNRHLTGATGLRDDRRFAFMLLGVQDFMLSRSCCLAFRTSCLMPARSSALLNRSDVSIATVPTRTGCWRS